MLKIFQNSSIFTLNYLVESMSVPAVGRRQTVYMIIECRLSRMFPLPEIPSFTFVSAGIAAAAASVSLRRIRFFPDITESPADWFIDWLYSVEVMDLPEFHDCAKAYHNWFLEILNSTDVPWTNGYIEGCNNKTKVLKRVSYGMRNFNNFRKRILFCNT